MEKNLFPLLGPTERFRFKMSPLQFNFSKNELIVQKYFRNVFLCMLKNLLGESTDKKSTIPPSTLLKC